MIGLISVVGFSQTTFEIKGFSEKYEGVLTLVDGYEEEVFKKGVIAIFDSKSQKKLFEIESEELTFDLDNDNSVRTNVVELPYGEQSILICQDFNFDGIKDLAVMDGQFSCYHGPSFQVYLDIDNKLIHSPEFTRLAQEYCGMFSVDYDTKTIHTMTKSGCCWHQFSSFKVVDNKPTPILVVDENAMDFPFHTTTITRWEDAKKIETIEKTIDLEYEGIRQVLSFTLLKSQKKVVVYALNGQVLNYVLIRPDSTVEFSYPSTFAYESPDFIINAMEDTLGFKNEEATYKIYEVRRQGKVEKIGIQVLINGKAYDLKGDVGSLSGSLKGVKQVNLHNVVYQ